jgi:hypothetical protein
MKHDSVFRRMTRPRLALIAVLLPLVFVLASCATSATPRVSFVEPKDGATVSSPLHAKMAAENFTVEPAGAVSSGHGHLHIMVDTDCVPTGQAIPKDDAHQHYGQGQTEADLQLAPGTHTLCLQAADGAHVALEGEGLRNKITVTVK